MGHVAYRSMCDGRRRIRRMKGSGGLHGKRVSRKGWEEWESEVMKSEVMKSC